MLILSLPITPYDAQKEREPSPIGFVLTPGILVTIRFDELHTFHIVGERLQQREKACGSAEIFTLLIEAIIDYGADKLELIKADTRTVSKAVFHRVPPRRRKVSRTNAMLRNILIKLGDMDERLSETRETLLVLQRAIPFVSDPRQGLDRRGHRGTADDGIQRYPVAERLRDPSHGQGAIPARRHAGFSRHRAERDLQGADNRLHRRHSAVFVAGVYGMNFHNQPEYGWAFGYEWGWFLIILSIVLPSPGSNGGGGGRRKHSEQNIEDVALRPLPILSITCIVSNEESIRPPSGALAKLF